MENIDINTLTIILAIVFIIVCIAAANLYTQVTKLEELLEHEHVQTKYYSKESLDRFEDISKLRMELVTLNSQKIKLEEELRLAKESMEKSKTSEVVTPEPELQTFVVTEMPKEESVVKPAKSYRRNKSSKKK